jgi:hypothetical protein
MEGQMRRRWSIGVAVAIAVAIAAAVTSGSGRLPAARAEAPVEVTLALQPDGAELNIARGRFVLSIEI